MTEALCDGNPRWAERRFGWGRETIRKGQREWQSGLRCVENFVAPGATGGGFGPPVLLEEHWRAKPLASGTRSDSQHLN